MNVDLSVLFGWPVVGIAVPVLIGVGCSVLSLSPPAFLIARCCFILAAFLLSLRWVTWSVKDTVWPHNLLVIQVALLILAGIGMLLVSALGWVSRLEGARATIVIARLSLPFKEDPRFTPQKRQAIELEISGFIHYLAGLGFDIPRAFPPLEAGQIMTGAPFAVHTSTTGAAYDETVFLDSLNLDNYASIRAAYSAYVVAKMVRASDGRLRDMPFRVTASSLLATYFAWSYVGRQDDGTLYEECFVDRQARDRWLAAMWDARTVLGSDTVDKIMFYSAIKVRDVLALAPAGEGGILEPGEFDSYFHSDLAMADQIVGSWRHLPQIFAMLTKHGIHGANELGTKD